MASLSRYPSTGLGRWVAGACQWIVRSPEGPLAASIALALLAMVEAGLRGDPPIGTGMLLGWAAAMPLALAREQLAGAAMMVTVANAMTLGIDRPPTVGGVVAQLAVLYLLGRRGYRLDAVLVVVFVAAMAAASWIWLSIPAALGLMLLVALAPVVGSARRVRSAAAQRDATRQAIAETLLEHAARGERARIARELHDVVAHHISMIAVQAETARLATPGMPEDGAKRLLAIGDTARAALTEMRRLLGVLREDASPEPTRAPQPGLHQLNELLDEARDSSRASTRLIVRGQVGPLDPGVELTAYRIVQEALTNARRHAPGAAVDVELDYTDDAVHLRIRDNGPGPPTTDAAGHGLLGMRERAAMVGGTLSAGPAPAGGFLIEATLPTAEAAG